MSQLINQPLTIRTKPLFRYRTGAGGQVNGRKNMETTVTWPTTRCGAAEGSEIMKNQQKSHNRFL